jgi:hypothetical protein
MKRPDFNCADHHPPGKSLLSKAKWARLRRAFVFGHSLGAIAQATGISYGTLSARSARHHWSRGRSPDVEILRKEKREHEP